MIVNRITTTEKTETVEKALTGKASDDGRKKLGAGVFGKVLTHPNPNLVIKIGKGVGDANRDGWLLWAQAAGKYPNPFVPRIVSLTVWESQSDGRSTYLAVMEKLHHFDRCDWEGEEKLAQLIHPTWKTVRSLESGERRARLIAKNSTQIQNNLYNAYRWCLEKHNRLVLDLHENNWMVRKTKNGDIPVITDPFAY